MSDTASIPNRLNDREAVLHALYEAAELEHNLMCTYLYAAFSLKDSEGEGLSAQEVELVKGWRRILIEVAIEEMGHLTAVWNITSALGASPRIGRNNFPIDPGYLPARIVAKLAPFNAETLQHFIFLERPVGSDEREGEGFKAEVDYVRGLDGPIRLVPMGLNYEAVGNFYTALTLGLRSLVEHQGEDNVFVGDPALQLTPAEIDLSGAHRVICLKTALQALEGIVMQGEGAARDITGSHFQRFLSIREELLAIKRKNPAFAPAFPAATNPVLRRPPRPEGRVWLENLEASTTVDLANAAYSLMLRLLAYAYMLHGPSAEKSATVELALGLMRAVVSLAERAARLPAGPSNPNCNAGVSFTALRDTAGFPPGRGARRFFIERFAELAATGARLASCSDARVQSASQHLDALAKRAARSFDIQDSPAAPAVPVASLASAPAPGANESSTVVDGVEIVQGKDIDIHFETKRCIHARFCVTWTPKVFLANVQGPWIHPDAMAAERVAEVAHACPSGAIQYRRHDGVHDGLSNEERAPPVNLATVRESGPYAFRGPLEIDGVARGFRATLCRCGASKNKPFCDGSHHEANFTASGEPPTGRTDALEVRDGVLAINPELNGPLAVRGNLEIVSGTGRIVARVQSARLCRCGGSGNKPFCDGTHAKIGFKS
jgi:CDGSH-type Zn-finger protein/uncharacterized Fe-S cluster protein YjdI